MTKPDYPDDDDQIECCAGLVVAALVFGMLIGAVVMGFLVRP